MKEFPDQHPDFSDTADAMAVIPVADYVASLGLYQITPSTEFRMQELTLRHMGLSWTPPEWKTPLRHTPLRPGGVIDWNSSDADLKGASAPGLSEEQLAKILEDNAGRLAAGVAIHLDRMGYLRKDPVPPKRASKDEQVE
ncbi:hypothetical protein ACFVIZ_06485 [Streptomyces anulatus]|uniref:hypothetical protein n=1 Tax=Streptomyces anulatus TaxID=1892 RepID=UPI00363D3E9F